MFKLKKIQEFLYLSKVEEKKYDYKTILRANTKN